MRYIFINFLVINRAEVNDSGIYSITLHRLDETHMILKVVTLAVHPIKTIVTLRETSSLSLNCYCAILGYLYANLQVSWLINNKTWKNYGTTSPVSVNRDEISSLDRTHQGLWQCIISQDDFNFRWVTNALKIRVISAPNWRTYLMEDLFTRPIFGWMPNEKFVIASVIIIVLLFISCVIVVTYCLIKFQRRLKGGMSRFVRRDKSNVINKSENVKLIKK